MIFGIYVFIWFPFSDEAHKMIVTWSSINLTDSFVIYGLTRTMLNMTQKGYSDMFVDGGSEKLSQFIHRVELVDLKPNTTYCEYYIEIKNLKCLIFNLQCGLKVTITFFFLFY